MKLLIALVICSFISCSGADRSEFTHSTNSDMNSNIDTATFAGGCFWCTEAVFQRLLGVISVTPGYTGGKIDNPSYEQVCEGTTGHAEAVQIEFDADKISFSELLEVFFKTHDPTTLNRQGADIGTQYRSAIFYNNEAQKLEAESIINKLNDNNVFSKKVVTKVEPLNRFFIAEDYHQDYYNRNNQAGYCQFVITPKLEKFEKIFKNKLKKE